MHTRGCVAPTEQLPPCRGLGLRMAKMIKGLETGDMVVGQGKNWR